MFSNFGQREVGVRETCVRNSRVCACMCVCACVREVADGRGVWGSHVCPVCLCKKPCV